ncbi:MULTISPECIES: aldehyde dehydrogenase family protein [unclassified Herbaspirillum]|uniref:aldehyde dehydrogenase family protein n=1 Tax=unclassified Herbaspirillum TaxID=2624150 RepID=UPI000E2FC65A|nr:MULTISPECIES: aldehyde dehydrogenase family protein [unclassified Herbaspirillum]RFB73368.1 aldehyde dehydrogenase family protein [Herbaspirillum sp. 3R-3a1]TFI10827.1 aldehyde dehydrogenase family protein [Herbaspirillum sp. 3R11]TFI16734.1 aldehyde dehydrogenase family protein [Herbaspirillum sp. 3R-11]TFI26781.1 aldehyde dehydrogenase family protein [Herbaspirillum sp. 3C11]
MKTILIDGRWQAAQDERTIDVIDPSNAKVFSSISRGGEADVKLAVDAARRALSGPWGRMTATERGRLLQKLGELILVNAEEIAQLEARDTGKPITVARNDVKVVARYFEFYGTAADKIHGETIPYLEGYNVSLVRVPHGVTAHIIPWNYPAQMFGRSLAPALAMGNATVLKPSEDACLSGIKIAELAIEAGFPPGALNLVTGYGHEAGAALTAHPGIDFATFTGSPEVGVMVQEATARNHVACVLELGGKSPQIVFEDVDFDKALPVIVKAITQNAGQTCSAGSRLLVQESIYDKFVAAVAERFKAVTVGTPEMDLDCGPIVNKKQYDRVRKFISEAVESGVPLLAEGAFGKDLPADGYFVKPAFFGRVPRDHRLACKEVFGPVLSAIPFKDEEDAIELANATEFGLAAGIWTENGGRQARVSQRVLSGQVFINCYGAGGGVELPFGGVKKSGHGREKGLLALEEMSTTKTVVHYYK